MSNYSSSFDYGDSDFDPDAAFAWDLVNRIGSLFYLIDPRANLFRSVDQVPNYLHNSWPFHPLLILIDAVARHFQGRHRYRYEDVVVSYGALLLALISRYAQFGLLIRMLDYLHDCRLVDVSIDSVQSWLLCLLLVELEMYWAHRALHQINILWAFHQFHHSGKMFTIVTGLRVAWFDLNVLIYIHALLAIIVPPPIILVHMQLTLLYQLWLHNETVPRLGILEKIINTPSSHRVHHGKDRGCIDKNFGAFLIIYDIIFGTYASEDDVAQPLNFGITTPTGQCKHDVLQLQLHYFIRVWHKLIKVNGLAKFGVIFRSPEWKPKSLHEKTVVSKSQLPVMVANGNKNKKSLFGDAHDNHEEFDRPLGVVIYAVFNAMFLSWAFYLLTNRRLVFQVTAPLIGSPTLVLLIYSVAAFTSLTSLLDGRTIGPILESIRCLAYFLVEPIVLVTENASLTVTRFLMVVRIYHLLAAGGWLIYWRWRLKDWWFKPTVVQGNNNDNELTKVDGKLENLSLTVLLVVYAVVLFWFYYGEFRKLS